MALLYHIEFDVAGLIFLFIILLIFKTQYELTSKSNRLFYKILLAIMATGLLDIITAFTISYAKVIPVPINLSLNTLYLAFSVVAVFYTQEYVKLSIDYHPKPLRYFNIFLILVYSTLLFLNFFTGILFSFSPEGEYVHGPLFLADFGIPLIFLSEFGIILYYKRKLFTKKQFFLNAAVLSMPILFSGLQIIFSSYLLTFFSYSLFTVVMLFSLETPDFIELEYLRKNLESEVQKQTARAVERQRQIELMSLETTRALAQAIDEKDMYTNGHSLRVSAYSILLAQSLNWDVDKIERLRFAALLHDIGKIGIPDSILNKPNKLSEDEYEIVKTHTIKGGKILHNLTSLPDAEAVAMYHHERYDGTGYPGLLKGKDIPDFVRIVMITDAYDAMTSNRIYRDELPKEEVIRRLEAQSGLQFDPDYLKIFIELINLDIF